MYSTTKDYGIGSCYPWPRDSFTYRGLCSHNACSEHVKGDLDLSAEQLEAIAAEVNEKRRAYSNAWQKKYREQNLKRVKDRERRFAAVYWQRHPVEIQAREQLRRQNRPDAIRENHLRSEAKIKASKRVYCTICGIPCSAQWELNRHNRSTRHLKNTTKAEAGVVKPYHCDLCDSSTDKKGSMKRHNRQQRHLQKVAEAKSSSCST